MPGADSWPFADPPNVGVFTRAEILSGAQPIAYVTHDDDDGSWQFHPTGDLPDDVGSARVVALREIVALDPSILALADLPLGWIAHRAGPDAPWVRSSDPRHEPFGA